MIMNEMDKQERGSVLVFVHKQEHADELMKNLMKQGAFECCHY